MLQHAELACDQQGESRLLTGKIALVTGASSGVGRVIALALPRQGTNLCLVGRKADTLSETATAVQRFSSAVSFQLDLTEDDSV